MISNVRNIIFDLGGVILNLDIPATSRALIALADHAPNQLEGLKTDLSYLQLEVGEINRQQFCDAVRKYYSNAPSNEAIISAWNAMILDIPKNRLELLLSLKSRYRTFLFSNTNEIHLECYNEYLKKHYGADDFQPYFEKVYYSHTMRLRKPFREAFEYILKDRKINAEETLFVDDTLENIETAAKIGMQVFHCQPPDGMLALSANLI
jgi:HAD superfamily hydrolase (TIGR01509 family)